MPCHDATRTAGTAVVASGLFASGSGLSRASINAAIRDAAAAAATAANQERMERSVTVDVDGMHFCSQLCAETKFKRALASYCSVCQTSGHQNNSTWFDYSGNKGAVEKFRHPLPGGTTTVHRRNAQGNPIGGPPADGHCIVGPSWPGAKLQGGVHVSRAEALAAFKTAVRDEPSYGTGSQWQGEPLYPLLTAAPTPAATPSAAASSTAAPSTALLDDEEVTIAALGEARPSDDATARVRPDPRAPCISAFPPSARPGAFLAHLDAAGAPRSYGKHWPYAVGTKISAVLTEVERIRETSGSGSRSGASSDKVVIFSDGIQVRR